jgi:hypothetical protein
MDQFLFFDSFLLKGTGWGEEGDFLLPVGSTKLSEFLSQVGKMDDPKGTVQRKLTGVERDINRKVFLSH